MSWLNLPKSIKEKRKNFKTDNCKRDQPQKCRANNFGGNDWKLKFYKAIKKRLRFKINYLNYGY